VILFQVKIDENVIFGKSENENRWLNSKYRTA